MPLRPRESRWPGRLIAPARRLSRVLSSTRALFWFPLLLLGALAVPAANAQDKPPPLPTPADTSAARSDAPLLPDSLRALLPADSLGVAPAPARERADGLDRPVEFSARDSLILIFDQEGGDRGRLVRDATVTYGDVKLHGHAIDILFDIEELRATGLPVDTGMVGMPRFEQGNDAFTGSRFAYNLRTQRGRVVGTRTQFDEGFIEAEVTKVTEDSTLYVLNGLYTTCDCAPSETPSYSLRAHKMKVVDQEWVYTGPIQLYIFNIPTPIWLPFGFLPAQEGRRSGPLPPEYGEDQRGFYLRNWGYYWAISDYMDLQLRAGLWTKGSWQLNPTFRYRLRNRYDGSLSVDLLRETSGERGDPDRVVRNTGRLRWNHNQTLNPTARFTAAVDLSSSSYLRTVSQQYDDNVRQEIGSSIQYNKRFDGGRSLALNLRHRQVLATGDVDLTLPQLTLSQQSTKPFERGLRPAGRDERWYERITVSYRGNLNNRYSFTPLPDDTLFARGDTAAAAISWYEALVSPGKYRRATGDETPFTFTASHSIPVSAPFALNRLPLVGTPFRLNVSPSFNYEEDWFLETTRQTLVDTTGQRTTGRRIDETAAGFFALRQFSASVSANTSFYGIFPVGLGRYQGLRHTVRPSLSFGYQPDFFGDAWGYARDLRREDGSPVVDTTSGEVVRYAIAPGVRRGEQRALGLSLSNIFETRRVDADSTGEERRRTLKLFNLDLSTSYNFAADSLRLAPISLNARTSILGKLNLNLSASFSPYRLETDADGRVRQVNSYVFSPIDFKLARLTRLSLSGDVRLRGNQASTTATARPTESLAPDIAGASSLGVVDPFASEYGRYDYGSAFSIPWSLGMRLTYSLSRPLDRTTRTLTLNTNFDFNLTPRWKLGGQTGYDFEAMELVTTTLDIRRDFQCWEMSFRWTPFGQFQSWGFDLHVKSGRLRDLLRIRQPRAERNRGFGGF